MIPRLGKSQNAVFELLKKEGMKTCQEIGDALYEKTSECFPSYGYGGMGGKSTSAQVRCAWANKAVSALAKKGLIAYVRQGRVKYWTVKLP